MKLESARHAKQEFVTEISRRATSVSGAVGPLRAGTPISVGIYRTERQDYGVAVRAERESSSIVDTAEIWNQRYPGEIDFRVTGLIRIRTAATSGARDRPVLPGSSISTANSGSTAGTLATFVRRGDDEDVEFLSNNHVLADENQARAGDPIVQPGAIDGGVHPGDMIGSLAAFVTLDATSTNHVDCASASLHAPTAWSLQPFEPFGGLGGSLEDDDDAFPAIAKIGRTTRLTLGAVSAIEVDGVRVQYDMGILMFDGQIEFESSGKGAFSAPGDSGSLIFATTRKPALAVALLFAGSETGGRNGGSLTYGNPINRVLQDLDAKLVLNADEGVVT